MECRSLDRVMVDTWSRLLQHAVYFNPDDYFNEVIEFEKLRYFISYLRKLKNGKDGLIFMETYCYR